MLWQVVIGRWLAEEDNAYGVTPGSYSWGVWPLSPSALWGAYRLHDAEGSLVNYRFDAIDISCGRLTQSEEGGPHCITFHDLLLDAKVWPVQGESFHLRVEIEDEDEVEAAREQGKLSQGQLERITEFHQKVTTAPQEWTGVVDGAIGAAIEAAKYRSRLDKGWG